jgi:hypothetical protein
MFNVSVRKIVVSAVAIAAPIALSLGASTEAWGGGKTSSWDKAPAHSTAGKTSSWDKHITVAGKTSSWDKKTSSWD